MKKPTDISEMKVTMLDSDGWLDDVTGALRDCLAIVGVIALVVLAVLTVWGRQG